MAIAMDLLKNGDKSAWAKYFNANGAIKGKDEAEKKVSRDTITKIFDVANGLKQQGIPSMEKDDKFAEGRRMAIAMDLVQNKEISGWANYFDFNTGSLVGKDEAEKNKNRDSVVHIFVVAENIKAQGIEALSGNDSKSEGNRMSIAMDLEAKMDGSDWAAYFDLKGGIKGDTEEQRNDKKSDVQEVFNIVADNPVKYQNEAKIDDAVEAFTGIKKEYITDGDRTNIALKVILPTLKKSVPPQVKQPKKEGQIEKPGEVKTPEMPIKGAMTPSSTGQFMAYSVPPERVSLPAERQVLANGASVKELMLAQMIVGATPVEPEYKFAQKYAPQDIVANSERARAFIDEYLQQEGEYFKIARNRGIAVDGWNLNPSTLKHKDIREHTAASKESLDIAVLVKALNGNKYAASLIGNGDAAAAKAAAIKILEEKIASYKQFNKDFSGFGGFLPWIKTTDRIEPTGDWSDRVPALDNGEWVWAIYSAYHTLQNIGEKDLANEYKKYFDMLAKNAPVIFYDNELKKLRIVTAIKDPKTTVISSDNYSNWQKYKDADDYNIAWLYEGQMMVYFLDLFTDLPERANIWEGINMEKVTTTYGTTFKGWPQQSPLDGSPHIKWAFMFLPFTDNATAMKVYGLQEKIRTNLNKYGIPVSTNTPGGIGYTQYEPNVFAPYGAFSMIYYFALQGDVTKNNYGLAWLANMLQADKMQGPTGSGESFSVKPGTNQLEEVSFINTVDGKFTIWLAMMGGNIDEIREGLKKDGLYEKFMADVKHKYAETFGDLSSVVDDAQFRLPTQKIEGVYTPMKQSPTMKNLDLSTFWKYPAFDMWGSQASPKEVDGKMAIEYKPGPQGGWGWGGGSFVGAFTPAEESAIYLKGNGSFTLKLEGMDKSKAFTIPVRLNGEDKWTKVPLKGAFGNTFFIMAIDQITENITIGDRFYSYDGNPPEIGARPARQVEEKRAAKPEKITDKEEGTNLLLSYNLSRTNNWGTANVAMPNGSLIVKHNEAKDGSGWSWAGEGLKKEYVLKSGEGISITGEGKFTLKLEGSDTIVRDVDLDRAGFVILKDLPAGLKISSIVIDKVMPRTSVTIQSIASVKIREAGPIEPIVKPAPEEQPVKPAQILKGVDLLRNYNLATSSNWGGATVVKSDGVLTVKHNRTVDGGGWSWAGEALKKEYALKKNEGVEIKGKGKFTLKLEGSETVLRDVDLDESGSALIKDLPAGLKIQKIIIDKVMPGTSITIHSMQAVDIKPVTKVSLIKPMTPSQGMMPGGAASRMAYMLAVAAMGALPENETTEPKEAADRQSVAREKSEVPAQIAFPKPIEGGMVVGLMDRVKNIRQSIGDYLPGPTNKEIESKKGAFTASETQGINTKNGILIAIATDVEPWVDFFNNDGKIDDNKQKGDRQRGNIEKLFKGFKSQEKAIPADKAGILKNVADSIDKILISVLDEAGYGKVQGMKEGTEMTIARELCLKGDKSDWCMFGYFNPDGSLKENANDEKKQAENGCLAITSLFELSTKLFTVFRANGLGETEASGIATTLAMHPDFIGGWIKAGWLMVKDDKYEITEEGKKGLELYRKIYEPIKSVLKKIGRDPEQAGGLATAYAMNPGDWKKTITVEEKDAKGKVVATKVSTEDVFLFDASGTVKIEEEIFRSIFAVADMLNKDPSVPETFKGSGLLNTGRRMAMAQDIVLKPYDWRRIVRIDGSGAAIKVVLIEDGLKRLFAIERAMATSDIDQLKEDPKNPESRKEGLRMSLAKSMVTNSAEWRRTKTTVIKDKDGKVIGTDKKDEDVIKEDGSGITD
ncbi:MAG: hypothetical protein WCY36_08000, partial [Candidatus Omnitrophota bacterium]